MVGKCRCLLALTVLFALAAVTVAGCRRAPRASLIQPTPIPTALIPTKPTYTVTRGTIADEVEFGGRITPIVEQRLSFRVDGRVMTVQARKGDQVRKGDILAELDTADLLNQLAQARLSLKQAQERLAGTQEGAGNAKTEAEIALAMARLRLERARAQNPAPGLAIAAANRDMAQAALQSAQAAYDQRAKSPGASGSPEALALQRATLQMQIVQAQYDQAVQAQKTHEIDLQILEYEVRLAEMAVPQETAGNGGSSPAADVAKAQLAVDNLQARLDNMRLISPFDGEVTLVGVAAGAMVKAYEPLLTVAAPGGLEIAADLLEGDVARLSVGLKATVTSPLYPGQAFHATIRQLPSPDGGNAGFATRPTDVDRTTRLSLDDAQGLFPKDVVVNVVVTLQKRENVLLLPAPALRTFQGRQFVVLLDGASQKRVPVKVGIKNDDVVEIESGVEESQVVVGP